MIRLAFLLVLICAPIVATAQSSGVYLTGSWSRVSYDADAMTMFNDTYSDYFVLRLEGPVELLPTGDGSLGLGFMLRMDAGSFGLGLGYTLSRAFSDNTALFENNAGRRIETRTLDHIVVAELTMNALAPLTLGAVFTGNFRGVKVRSVSIHPDGVESWGSEYILNGVYTGSAPHLEVGLLAGYQVNDRVFIPVRILYPFTFIPDRMLLKDYEVDHLNQYFPMDYHRYIQDPMGQLEDEIGLADKDFYSGLRIQFGVEIRLF